MNNFSSCGINPLPPTLANFVGSVLSHSLNKRVSGFGASHLRPNPRFARTSDTRWPLYDMLNVDIGGKNEDS